MRTLLIAGLAAAACATARPNYGVIAIKPAGAAASPPANFTVGAGRLSGQLIDAFVSDGCLRGTMGRLPLQLCDDGKGRWTGSSGDVTVKPTPDGKEVEVAGYLWLDTGRQFQLDGERLRFEEGQQWDELRKQPILLVVATAATDLWGGNLLRRPGY